MSRRASVISVASVAVVVLAACSGSSGSSGGGSSGGGSSTTSASTAPKHESAWVKQWQPVLTGAYATAQQAFLAAIQGGEVAEVQAAGQKVAVASAAFKQAVANAGPPPAPDATAAAKLVRGLETEGTIVAEVLRTCTGASDQCQAAVTAYGDNNSKQVVPALTALGVR